MRSVMIRPSESAQLAGTESGKRSRGADCPRRLRNLLQHILNHVQHIGHGFEFLLCSACLSVIQWVVTTDRSYLLRPIEHSREERFDPQVRVV